MTWLAYIDSSATNVTKIKLRKSKSLPLEVNSDQNTLANKTYEVTCLHNIWKFHLFTGHLGRFVLMLVVKVDINGNFVNYFTNWQFNLFIIFNSVADLSKTGIKIHMKMCTYNHLAIIFGQGFEYGSRTWSTGGASQGQNVL